jgi:hypothetical protein
MQTHFPIDAGSGFAKDLSEVWLASTLSIHTDLFIKISNLRPHFLASPSTTQVFSLQKTPSTELLAAARTTPGY